MFPGPVIRGQKGDRFQLNVVNNLDDSTMERSTSVVRISKVSIFAKAPNTSRSIGMAFSRKGRTGPTERLSLRSALYLPLDLFFMTSMWTHRSARTGIMPISVRRLPFAFEKTLICLAATQYCDGLRGAFIVDDPNDLHALLYDVDDGMFTDAPIG